MRLEHPLKTLGYDFAVPMLAGDHVTAEAGTGFVHTAPGHGGDDFDIWTEKRAKIEKMGISSAIPFTVDDAGYYTADAPAFGPDAPGGPARVIDDKGKKGDANKRVIAALIEREQPLRPRSTSSTTTRTAGAPRNPSSSATPRNGSSTWTAR